MKRTGIQRRVLSTEVTLHISSLLVVRQVQKLPKTTGTDSDLQFSGTKRDEGVNSEYAEL